MVEVEPNRKSDEDGDGHEKLVMEMTTAGDPQWDAVDANALRKRGYSMITTPMTSSLFDHDQH